MGLESLLARLENQIPATPKEVQPLEHLEHQGTPRCVPGNPLQNKPGTPEIQQGWPDISKPDLAALVHPDLSGVSPVFAARLSAEDLEDIAAGDIPLGTVQVFEEAAIAREAEDLREAFKERAGIIEHDAGLPPAAAELEGARITATLARNRGYLWVSLRAALAGYPVLLAQVPDRAGPVDALPLGTAKLVVLKGRRMVRRGGFTGSHEVVP
jgi:hypothetical protein